MALNARFSLIEAEAERQDVQFKMTIQNPKALFGDVKPKDKETPVSGKRKRSSDGEQRGVRGSAGKPEESKDHRSPAKKVVLSNRVAVAAANQPGRKTVALAGQKQAAAQPRVPVVVPRGAQQQQQAKVRRASEQQAAQQPQKFAGAKAKPGFAKQQPQAHQQQQYKAKGQSQQQYQQQQVNGKKSFKAAGKPGAPVNQPKQAAAAGKKSVGNGKPAAKAQEKQGKQGKAAGAQGKPQKVLTEDELNAQLDKFMGRDPNQGKVEVEAARLDAELDAYARQRAQVAPGEA